jgi:hypothetical protein
LHGHKGTTRSGACRSIGCAQSKRSIGHKLQEERSKIRRFSEWLPGKAPLHGAAIAWSSHCMEQTLAGGSPGLIASHPCAENAERMGSRASRGPRDGIAIAGLVLVERSEKTRGFAA